MPFLVAAAGSLGVTTALYRPNATPSVSPLVRLMGLYHLEGQTAPPFTLTDQHARTVSLARFQGESVLLAFVDPRCACQGLAHELRLADRDLAGASSRVALVAVDANPMDETVAAVQGFTHRYKLGRLRNWYFLTGTTAALEQVWGQYNIQVVVPKGADRTVHTDTLYFLDPHGRERYVATGQTVGQTATGSSSRPSGRSTALWGEGIATYLRKALRR